MTGLGIDLLDPAFHVGDPHTAYRHLRAEQPIFRDRNGIVGVTRMDHLRQVERRSDVFVSSRGYRSQHFPHETSMIAKDDPEHQAQRRLVSDLFTPRAVARHEDLVRSLVDEALATTRLDHTLDVIDTLAARLPALVTCELIGWPRERWRDVRSWSERLMRVDLHGRDPLVTADMNRAVLEMAAATRPELERRRTDGGEDLFARWADADAASRCPMSEADVVSELGLVVPGGAETTRTTLARSMILFSERPDLWERLADEPATIPTAVEELLRWITPLNNMFRVAAEDTEVDGHPIAEGERVALIYPSANRDENVFDSPDEVRLDRDPNPHISFGFGTHFCLGAHLARLMLRVSLEEMTRRFTNVRAVAPPVYEANVFVTAVDRFAVSYTPR